MIRRPPGSTLFPYPTLFRSVHRCVRSPEIATASGSISAMSFLNESSRSEEAGRPKWRSETWATVVTETDSTQTAPTGKPPGPLLDGGRLYAEEVPERRTEHRRAQDGVGEPFSLLKPLLQEFLQSRVEPFRGFEVREVARAGEGHVARVRDLLGHRAHDLGRGDPILLAADDQRGDLDLSQKDRK